MMTTTQQITTIVLMALVTVLTRALPFLLFGKRRSLEVGRQESGDWSSDNTSAAAHTSELQSPDSCLPTSKLPDFQTPKLPTEQYLGRVLPLAVFAMLVVYCLRDVNFLTGHHGLPQLIGIAATIGLHLWRRQMLLSIAGGTITYMLLTQLLFR